ncbi:uncharacterized protein LOC110373895 [Helicoverpa armigera]|uniref:uncharacterized protein LOC110373895 n=1 Tax=Helicoverpa armigera TaxID=29058 RepID=UPI00308302C6
MAPKKEKKPDVFDENAWRTVIEEAPLDEEHWKVKVVLIESAGSDQERMYLNKFEVFAAEEKRFVIKNICKTETIFMINQLGAEKKVKDDNLRVFEEAQSYLKDKKDIPADVLALVVKHLILKMKDEYLYISKQRLEVKQGVQRESATMIDKEEVKGSVSAQKPTEPEVPPPAAKAKGKGEEPVSAGSDLTEGKKFNTLLRVRGEEWRDKVYVDDYPTDGPNLYVAVTGFVEPYLPGCLVKVGIPLTAVVQIRIDPNTTPIPSSLLKQTKRGQSLTELLAEKSSKFWDDLQFLRINKDSADDFKDTAFIVFAPPYWNSENLSGNPDKIYDEICFLMYDIQDLSRQHLHYQNNMSIIEIPEETYNERSAKHYDQQIHDLPLECVTIYSVLDVVLQIVCNNQELQEETSRSSLSTAVTLNGPQKITEEHKTENAETLVRNVFNTLCNTDASKKTYRVSYGEEYEDQKDPIVINYGDIAKYNTFHLGNINLDNIIFSSLLGMPIHNLFRSQNRPAGELEAKINFHVNVLLSCFERDDVETAELSRLIHILACRKLYNNRSSLKKRHLPTSTISEFKKNYLKRSVMAEPLPTCPSLASGHALSPSFPSMTKSDNDYEYACSNSDPDPEVQRLKFLFECPDISELVTAVEIQNNEPVKHSITDDFDSFEDLAGICSFQILREAFNKFNCVDYKYCEVTDCFILMFYNSHNKDGIAREEWRCHLATPLCLQDFFDFILEEHYDWIQNEEKIYDENLLTEARSISKDFIDPHALQSCLETTDVETDLLMEGSLKHQEMVPPEESAHELMDDGMPRRSISPTSADSSKSSKKTKSASLPKAHSFHENGECQASVELPAKPFLGYDLGDRRVEVFGKDATFFSKDGTKVVSMYTLTIPLNLEYIVLNVLPGNSHNEFWMHKALGDTVQPEIRDACESFRITTKDQVMIYIKKQMYQQRVSLSVTDPTTSSDKKAAPKVLSEKVSTVVQSQVYETKYFHSLYVTWPNGMITETVHEENSPILSHIKQYHTRPMPYLDEEMRCISLNGEVIIFKSNGDIEVLKPDGTFIKILKYYKAVVLPLVPEEVKEEPPPVVEKGKKSKGKLSKASSKSSKVAAGDEDKISEEKPIEYEIIVDEFEIIEANGLRQKWIQNIPFDIERILIRTATDHNIGEVFSRRMDGTNSLINKDGLHVVTFPDKTRIITTYVIDEEEVYPEWSDVEIEYFELFQYSMEGRSKGSVSQKSDTGDYYGSSGTSFSKKIEEEEIKETERTDGYLLIHILYTIEHSHFSTVSINTVTDKISVESPNKSVVFIDKHNNYEVVLDSETSATFNGENLNISFEACSECRAFTTCDVKILTKENPASLTNVEPIWLKMTDSFNRHVYVDEEGSVSLPETPPVSETNHTDNAPPSKPNETVTTNNTEEKEFDAKSETSVVSHAKCREMYLAKNVRFFVLKRELNCAELLHRALLEQYKRECRWKPWCSINHYDTFGDHRSLVTILTPVHLTETEKWVMESKQASKPKFLTYKDLKKDTGKGFYHWMRPYERFVSQPMKPDNILPERLPRAYILRILEQEWDEQQDEQLRGGRELLRAILRYRCIMEADSETILNIPIIDSRTEDERQIDDIIQALAHKIYEDLKVRVAADVQKRVKPEITSRPAKQPEDLSVEGEFDEDTIDETKNIEEDRESILKEVEEGQPMSPALRKYWRRRQEELKEEQFYKYLLREGSVPPYFRNVLGGAIWWEINNAASTAVTVAERRIMKCVCADEDTLSVGGSVTDGPFI